MIETAQPAAKRNRVGLFFRSLIPDITGFYKRHWLGASLATLVLLSVVFLTRSFFHPYVVGMRRMSFLVVPLALIVLVWFWARRRSGVVKVLTSLVCLSGLVALIWWGGAAHDYVALYYRYQTL